MTEVRVGFDFLVLGLLDQKTSIKKVESSVQFFSLTNKKINLCCFDEFFCMNVM